MADIFLPTHMVVSGVGVPSVCTRHGDPAVDRPKTIFQSRPPAWSYLLILIGALPFVVVVMVLRKTVTAPGWPLCARCRGRRRALRLVAGALFLLTVLSFAVALTSSGNNALVGATIFVGFVTFLASVVALNLAAEGVLVRGAVTHDGHSVRLRNVSPAFARALPPAPPQPRPAFPPQPPGLQQPRW